MTQPALFPPPPRPRPARTRTPAQQPTAARTGPPLGQPLNQADADLGWQHRYVTPARARQIRAELDARLSRVYRASKGAS